MSKSIDKTDVITFLGGAAAAGALYQFIKSRHAHKLAVNTVAGALKVQDETGAKFERIYEEAQDVYAEAKEKAGTPKKTKPAGKADAADITGA